MVFSLTELFGIGLAYLLFFFSVAWVTDQGYVPPRIVRHPGADGGDAVRLDDGEERFEARIVEIRRDLQEHRLHRAVRVALLVIGMVRGRPAIRSRPRSAR